MSAGGLVVGEVEWFTREREEPSRAHVSSEAHLVLRERGLGRTHAQVGEALVASVQEHVEGIARDMS